MNIYVWMAQDRIQELKLSGMEASWRPGKTMGKLWENGETMKIITAYNGNIIWLVVTGTWILFSIYIYIWYMIYIYILGIS